LDISDLEEFRKAALTQAWVQACFAAFLTTKNPQGAAALLNAHQGGVGEPVPPLNPTLNNTQIASGTILNLDPDSEVSLADPKSPGGTFDPFTKNVLRSIAATVGISYIALTRDFSETTYSGGRQADNEDRITYEDFAEDMDSEVLLPIYQDFVNAAYYINRLLPIPNAVNLYAVKIIHPTPREIDPVKEQTAYAAADALQTMSPQEICARQGRDFHDVVDQRLEADKYRMRARVLVYQTAREMARDFNANALDENEKITMRELAYMPDATSFTETLSTSIQNEKTINGDDPTNA
jgi:capsid protein